MAKKLSNKRALLLASIAGLLTVGGVIASSATAYADVHCTGVNACKGIGDCGATGHSCGGKNDCKGQGWLKFPSEDLCKKVGGTIVSQ